MDFESHHLPENSGELKDTKDHSPNENIDGAGDIQLAATKVSNSADDFEHIISDKFDAKYYGSVKPMTPPAGPYDKTFLDEFEKIPNDDTSKFDSSLPKHDDFDLFAGANKTKATIDFMAAERNGAPAERPKPTSIYDEIENDYLNPYASNKNNEKFISSEDLLGDFKESNETRTKTPELIQDKIIDEPIFAPTPIEPEVLIKPDIPIIKHFEPIIPVDILIPEPIEKQAAKPDLSHSMVEEIKPVTKSKEPMISAEEIFYKIGLDAWFKPDRLHPKVESLIYWRDPKKSGIVFGAGLAILLAISFFSVISVIAYISLLGLFVTISFRIYKNVLQAVQKTSEGHPFKEYLEFELALPQEKVQEVANVGVAHINAFLAELRRLFLVEDLVDSIKFGLLLWCLTYLGSWFNGMTLVILGFVALFTLPKVYENNKQSIDTYVDLVRSKILEITDKVKGAVPIGKKPESDKDK